MSFLNMVLQKLTKSFPFLWLQLLLILLSNASVDGVEKKALNFFLPFLSLIKYVFHSFMFELSFNISAFVFYMNLLIIWLVYRTFTLFSWELNQVVTLQWRLIYMFYLLWKEGNLINSLKHLFIFFENKRYKIKIKFI